MSPAADDPPGGGAAGHPAPEDIALLVDPGRVGSEPVDTGLAAADRPGSNLVDHAATCAACQEILADIRHAQAALAQLPAAALPPAIAVRLERALAAEQAGRKEDRSSQPARRRPAAWLAAAAAAAVLLGGGALLHGVLSEGGRVAPSTAQRHAGTAPSGSPGTATPGAGPGTAAEADAAATLPALVRSLVVAREPPRSLSGDTPMTGPHGGHLPPEPQPPAADLAVAHCLTVLGVSPGRLLVAADRPFAGERATVLVLKAGGDPTLVDVRVVRPGCARGTSDLVYRLDRLRL